VVALLLALAVDATVGELPACVHPVVWMGALITRVKRMAPADGALRQLGAGGVMAVIVPLAFAVPAWLLLRWLRPWPPLHLLLHTAVLTSTFALRELGRAGSRVRVAMELGDLDAARYALRSLCSRDASSLSEQEVAGAAIESLAENASDSFVAPLFYYAFFGLPGAVVYRAVNTLDAMIGYHGRYEYLGKASARLDDLLNFAPARLTALFLMVGGFVTGLPARRGMSIMRRDGATTESPNAGRPMAMTAGLLGVCLEKPGHYALGDATEPVGASHIDDAWRLVTAGAACSVTLSVLVVGARHVFL
jgi:adenosylcobinamide-phosphate synthase